MKPALWFLLFPLGVMALAMYPLVFFALLMFVAGSMYARKEF